MQGTDNFVRTYKQKDKPVREDKKRNKNSDKQTYKKLRKLREKEIEE